MLTPKEAQKIKERILQQIDNFPEEKREAARQQIIEMNDEELEQFLIQNKLVTENNEEQDSSSLQQSCIFCSIRDHKTPSYILKEEQEVIAVLDINPQSLGHTIIIPTAHNKDIAATPIRIFGLVKELAQNIQEKFSPKEIKLVSQVFAKHLTFHLIPQYTEGSRLPKEQLKNEEFNKLQKQLQIVNNKKEEQSEEKIEEEEIYPAPKRRIP